MAAARHIQVLGSQMHKAVSLFTLTAATIVAAWWWLGRPVPMPASPIAAGEKLSCVSYAPFRGRQSPLDLSTHIDPRQIDEDLAQLARFTECVRTYSVDFGLDRVPELAQRHGLKVLLGLWVSSHADRVRYQLDTGIALAKRYPDVVRAVIVGNEALLRGEIAPGALRDLIRRVKSQVAMPVTYADVWEFWLRHRELADAVDFVTIHILPYWEDNPIGATLAAAHVDSIRKHVAAEFAGKEILLGEVGWPSAGRMREGALPSPANQARVVHDILARSKAEQFRVNIIEAFDQPWKRHQEGTVGGHWGLFDDPSRRQKFVWGEPVSDHPQWGWQAAGGVVFAGLIFAVAARWRRRAGLAGEPRPMVQGALALNAAVAGVLLGWTVEQAPVESFGAGGWLRSLTWLAVALAAPLVGGVALAVGAAAPGFARMLGRRDDRVREPLPVVLGIVLLVLTVIALQSALSLAFDPRYRDFPFAPLTAGAVPFMLIALTSPPRDGGRPLAESVAAVLLAFCAAFVAWNETLANWQALWFAMGLGLLALTLARARAAPG